jgi:hypothetical protein
MEAGQEHRPYRRFGLGDGLILMAALAFTLVVLRDTGWFIRFPDRVAFWWEASLELLRLRHWTSWFTRRQAAYLVAGQIADEILVQLLSSVLFGLTPVQPLLRLRRPRSPFREVMRQSGLVACLGVIVGTLIATDIHWLAGVDPGYGLTIVSALALLWPLLGVFPWRSEASWIDRLGRVVGWGWIVVMAAATAAAYLLSYW